MKVQKVQNDVNFDENVSEIALWPKLYYFKELKCVLVDEKIKTNSNRIGSFTPSK